MPRNTCCVDITAAFAATAMAFTDIADEKSDIQDAINLFAAQGILNGYEQADGTFEFMPDNTITREEFAKIVVLYTGNGLLADLLANTPSEFTDVKAGSWYAKWVNTAAALGYVKGQGEGFYGVGANVTYGEVVTVALRLAGYNDNLPGSWPYDYVLQASKVPAGQTTSLVKAATAFEATTAATRRDVILIFNQLLSLPVVSYDKEGTTVETMFPAAASGNDVQTAFNAMKPGEEFESADIKYDADDAAFTIDGKTLASNFAISNGFTLEDLILNDYAGTYYVVEEDGEAKVSFVNLGGKYVEGFVTATTDATASKDGSVTVGGVAYVIPAGGDTVDEGAYVNIVLDDEGKVADIDAASADFNGAVVVKLADNKLSYDIAPLTGSTGSLVVAVAEDEEATFIVIKDGVFATVADIKVGDLVYDRSEDNTLDVNYVYEVISPVGEAAITGITSDNGTTVKSATINGAIYEYAIQIMTDANFETIEVADYTDDAASTTDLVLKDKVGTFYTDANGLALAMVYTEVEEEVAEDTIVYGFIADGTIVTGTTGGNGLGVGATNTYLGYSDLTLTTLAGDVKYAVKDNGFKANGTNNIFAADTTGVYLDTNKAVVKGMFVKATVNAEGIIIDLDLIVDAWFETGAFKTALLDEEIVVNAKYNTIAFDNKFMNFASDIPVFQVVKKNTAATGDPVYAYDKVIVSASADMVATLAGEESVDAKVIYNNTTKAIEAIVIEKITAAPVAVENKNYVVLESLFADGDKIKFYGDDTLYAKTADTVGNGFAAGDIVTYTLTGGKVSALTEVCKLNLFAEAAAKVGSVAGAVVNLVGEDGNANTTGGVVITGGANTSAYFIISDETLVLVYTGDEGVAEEFSAVGTAADIVKDALVVGLDLDTAAGDKYDPAVEIVIVVK